MKFTSDFSATSAPHRARQGWLPQWLFRSGEAGAWFEPFDLATLFQDSAGTTPVAAAGDPVGKMLDKSGNGHHATQATSAARPIYAVAPAGGVRNLLTYSEDFTSPVWIVAGGLAVAQGAEYAVLGTTTAGGTGFPQLVQTATLTAGTWTFSIDVAQDQTEFAEIQTTLFEASGNGVSIFDLVNGTVSTSAANHTTSITALGGGVYRCSATFTLTTGSDTLGQVRAQLSSGGSTGPVPLDGLTSIRLYRTQLEAGAVATDYQKVLSSYDVTEAGVTSVSYLSFDGVDDFLTLGDVLSFGTSDITVAFGVDGAGGTGDLISKRGTGPLGSNPGWGIRNVGYGLNLEYDDGVIGVAPAPIGSTSGIQNRSVHVVEIEHGVSARSYMDGVLSATTADISALGDVTGTKDLMIGKEPTGVYKFTGNIFGITIREGLLTSGDRDRLTRHIAARSGVTL